MTVKLPSGLGKRDAHVAAARPDVQRMRLQRELVVAPPACAQIAGGSSLAGGISSSL